MMHCSELTEHPVRSALAAQPVNRNPSLKSHRTSHLHKNGTGFASGGNDVVFAGGGGDILRGGSGDDVLVAGDGDDILVGGEGRDILIGGFGKDNVVGDAGDDILIAGNTAYDANAAALLSILREWTSDGSYSARIANVTAGTGLTAGYRLVGADGGTQTVFNDNEVDTLYGKAGQDWFLANQVADNGGAIDTVIDQANNETYFDTDF